MSWIFKNTPTFSLSDGFQWSYGHCFWDPTFFYSPCRTSSFSLNKSPKGTHTGRLKYLSEVICFMAKCSNTMWMWRQPDLSTCLYIASFNRFSNIACMSGCNVITFTFIPMLAGAMLHYPPSLYIRVESLESHYPHKMFGCGMWLNTSLFTCHKLFKNFTLYRSWCTKIWHCFPQ